MANQGAERFIKNLVAVSCRRFKPDVVQLELYRSKISKWYLTDEQWARAMSRLAAEYNDEGLPALSVVYGYLKGIQTDVDKGIGQFFLMFTLDGLRYAQRISDPSRAFAPDGAQDIHMVIPPEMQQQDEPAGQLMEVPS